MKYYSLTLAVLLVFVTSSLFAQGTNVAEDAKTIKGKKHNLRVTGTDSIITVLDGDQPIFVYNKKAPPLPEGIKPVYARDGMIHPLYTPSGQVVTGLYPADHAHQSGIFAAWVRTVYDGRKVDFWNLSVGQGRVVHERVVSTFADNSKVGFEVDHLHRIVTDPQVDVLRERWKLSVFAPVDGNYCFDLETTQKAITDKTLVVQENRYGGVAIRGLDRWVLKNPNAKKKANTTEGSADGDEKAVAEKKLESFEMLNDRGEDRISGNHKPSKWVSMWGLANGKPVSVTVMCHPSNFRGPQTARLHNTKPYFCFAPCVNGEFEINKEHPYTGRYRYFVSDAKPDPEWLDQKWAEFAKGN